MSLSGLLNLQQKIQDLLMFRQPLFWGQAKRPFQERHVQPGLSRRAPSRPGVRRQAVFAVDLRHYGWINHQHNLTPPELPSITFKIEG
jgi:hypothetical protein